ncbi:hypothetical protein MD484_g584, partial [Candolleomyces efflorescens]
MAPNTTGTSSSGLNPNAAAPAWRQFSFFDMVPVKDPHDLESSPYIFKVAAEISTMVSSSAGMLVADIHGSVHLLNREFESITSWVAHVGGRVTHMVERKGILVTLGEEDSVKSPLLKIWDLENRDKKMEAPTLLRSTKIQLNNKPHPITTIALSSTLSHLAIGLGDGTVLLYRHLDQSLSSSTSLTSLPKHRIVHESPTEPITGLGFREPTTDDSPANNNNSNNNNNNLYLFIVTTNRVLCYQAAGRGSGGAPTVVDEIGCGLGCATMDWRARDMVVARDEALYICSTDGRGACLAYEGHKSSVHTHLNYLVIVSPPFFPSASAASATVRNFVARSTNPSETDITKVNVFDLENKLVAYSGAFKQGVREVVSQWGKIYVLSTDGNLLSLEEKPTSDKLAMLYRKSLYPIALNLAKTQDMDEASVADIHKRYGDHLYGRGSYDEAMQQYLRTIGWVQPSYVIRKFLDSQRIHNLVTYLQELHTLSVANSDHTTLLLNTYTKLKDVARLDTFIKTTSTLSSSSPSFSRRGVSVAVGAGVGGGAGGAGDSSAEEELPFDLDTAIRVCRQAGYFEHAGYLAKKYERHEDYLRILVEDVGDVREAIGYLRVLGAEASLPEETTQLLVDLCTSTGALTDSQEPHTNNNANNTEDDSQDGQPQAPAPSYLSYLALNRAAAIAAPTVVSAADTVVPPSPSIKTIRDAAPRRGESSSVYEPTTSPPPARTGSAGALPSAGLQQVQAPVPAPAPTVKRLSPRIYFPHFADHMEQFVVFLERVAKRRWGQSVDDRTPGSIGIYGVGKKSTVDPYGYGNGNGNGNGNGEGDSGEWDVSSPRQQHKRQLTFLDEQQAEVVDRQDQVAVWNTLLELYLTLPSPSSSSTLPSSSNGSAAEGEGSGVFFSESVMRDKALRVLASDQSQIPFDTTHALILCSTHAFTDGLVLLWEKLGMFEDVLRFWMDKYHNDGLHEASDKVVRHLMQYGPEHPELYPLVLRFLTGTPELLRKHEGDVREMVEYVDEEGIVPPLGIVQVLSRNGVASVGLMKEWLVKRIRESREEIHNLETTSRRKLVEELSDPEQPKVFHNTRCAICHAQLDLPTVHFMCGHSYHQRCLADNDAECLTCAQEHSVIREIRRNNERLADQHDLFLAEVKESGFEAIASAYSRGLLNAPRVEEQAQSVF